MYGNRPPPPRFPPHAHAQYPQQPYPPHPQHPPYASQPPYSPYAHTGRPYPAPMPHAPVRPPPAQPSSYESQAARWKHGFKSSALSSATSSSKRRQVTDLEHTLLNEACSSVGSSSFPPRDVVQKLLRHLPSLDHQYVCELLDDKLDDRLWQVQAKALSVLDAILKTPDARFFMGYYVEKACLFEELSQSRKDMLRSRADKVFKALESYESSRPPPIATQATQEQPRSPSQTTLLVQTSPIIQPTAQYHEPPSQPLPVTVSPSPIATSGATTPPPSSAFGFLNPAPAAATEPATSAFSFLAAAPPAEPVPDVFGSLPPPKPIPVAQLETPAPAPVSDPIHDAFEGLSLGNDEDTALHPLDSVETSCMTATPIDTQSTKQLNPEVDVIQEVVFEMEVPPGPMGLVLDRSIVDMAVIERFIPLPNGQRGILELHPAICPGCALISINSMHVEHKGLDEVGPILASLAGNAKILRFKKLIHNGRTVNPSSYVVPYTPPPVEEEEQDQQHQDDPLDPTDDKEDKQLEDTATCVAPSSHMMRLMEFEQGLQEIEQTLNGLDPSIPDRRNRLAQLHGDVERIQTQGIDAVILGPNPPPDYEQIKQFRSSLVRNCDALAKRIQTMIKANDAEAEAPSAFAFVTTPAAPEPVASAEAPVSPKTTGFNFMQTSDPAPTASTASAFSFLSSQPAPPVSPSSSTVFAGLHVQPTASEATESSSASGFLSGAPAAPPPSSSFSFLQCTAPQNEDKEEEAASSVGSAFSFISG